MIEQNKYTFKLNEAFLILGIIATLFISNTFATIFLGVNSVNTVQSLFVILYFITSINKKYFDWRLNRNESRLLILAITALLISMLHGAVSRDPKYIFFMFCMPFILMISIKYSSAQTKRILKIVVLLFFFIECGLAIYEKLTMTNLFPYFDDDTYSAMYTNAEFSSFRSSALLGHPLMNANVVVTLYSFIIINLKKGWHFFSLSLLTLFTLSSFDARAATLIFLIIFALFYVNRFIAKSRFKLFYIVLIVLVGSVGLNYYASLEIAGRLFSGEELIDGSAQTRLYFIDQLKLLYLDDLFFGFPNRKDLLVMENGLMNENGLFLFLGNWGLPMLIFYLYIYFQLIRYYFGNKLNIDSVIVLLGSFGIAVANPNFMSITVVTFLVIGLTLFTPRSGEPISTFK